MNKREEQKVQRRMHILEAGINLFAEKGYAATKITDIAKEVQMSDGLLFHYFPSKEKLYEEIVSFGLEGTRMAMQSEVNPEQFFRMAAEGTFQSLKERPVLGKLFILMAQTQRSKGVPEHIRQMALQVNNIERSIPMIVKGQKQGVFRMGDAYALSNAFWCSLQGIAEQKALHPELPLPEPEWIMAILLSSRK